MRVKSVAINMVKPLERRMDRALARRMVRVVMLMIPRLVSRVSWREGRFMGKKSPEASGR